MTILQLHFLFFQQTLKIKTFLPFPSFLTFFCWLATSGWVNEWMKQMRGHNTLPEPASKISKARPAPSSRVASLLSYFYYYYYYYPSPTEFLPVSGPSERWCASTLGFALLCSSRAGSDLGLASRMVWGHSIGKLCGLQPWVYTKNMVYILFAIPPRRDSNPEPSTPNNFELTL